MMQPPAPTTSFAPPAVTFVLNDAGETNGLQPVRQQLDALKVPYAIMAKGTARQLLGNDPHLVPLPEDVVSLSQQAPNAAAAASTRLQQALNAKVVVTGVVSAFQNQWASYFKRLGKPVLGFYDAFSYNTLKNRADAFQNSLTGLMTSNRDTANFFRKRFPNLPVMATGQPVLERNHNLMAQVQPALVQQALGLKPNQPTVLFVGGYGADYTEAFTTFCKGIQTLPNATIILALHPKSSGAEEEAILSQLGLNQRVKVVPKQLDTLNALAVADVAVSQNSSMNTQALLEGKKVMLVGTPAQPETAAYEFDPAVAYAGVQRYTNPLAFQQGLASVLATVSQNTSATLKSLEQQRLATVLGIPANVTNTISNVSLQAVNA